MMTGYLYPSTEAGRKDMDQENDTSEDLAAVKEKIRKLSESNAVSIREIILYFQTLVSARANRLLMEAPGLYFPDLPLYVISKSGMMARGHASIYQSIIPHLPKEKRTCYAFVLYPESFVRTCLDRLLRKTTKNITKELRLSMENVFNRKHHNRDLVDSEIENELISLLKKDL